MFKFTSKETKKLIHKSIFNNIKQPEFTGLV